MTERRLAPPSGLGVIIPPLTLTQARPRLRDRVRSLEQLEPYVVVALALALYLALSAYVIIDRDLRGGDPASRLLNAYLVTHGDQQKLASIGFVFPPVQTLVLIPAAVVPGLFETFYAVGMMSAIFAAGAVYWIWRAAALFPFSRPMRLAIVALFAFNPMMLVFAVNGMGESLAYLFLAAAAYNLLALDQSHNIKHVIFAGLWLGVAAVTRYELALVAVAVGITLFLRYYWEEPLPHQRRDYSRWTRASGVFLAFSAVAIYPMLLWLLANWLIMGHPLWFVVGDQGILNVTPEDAAVGVLGGLRTATQLTLLAFPAAFVAVAAALAAAVLRRSTAGLTLAAAVAILPLIQVFMLALGAGLEIIRYYTMIIPLSFVALLYAVDALRRLPRIRLSLGQSGAVLLATLFLGGVVSGYTLETQTQFGNIEFSTWQALQGQRVPPGLLDEAIAVGQEVQAIIPPGERVLIDYFGTGYTVRFGLTDSGQVLDFTAPDFEAATKNPWSYVDWVLLPEPVGRHLLNPIQIYHPELYAEVSVIAEKVREWPDSANKWKLFRLDRGATPLPPIDPPASSENGDEAAP